MLLNASKLHRNSYEDFFAEAEQACDWLTKLGVRVNATRLALQIKNTRKWVSQLDIFQPATNDYWTHLWQLAEIDDVIQIARNLHEIKDTRFLSTLKKITSGPTLLSNEGNQGGSIQGRNAAFELFAAARFARAGLLVSFDSDADATVSIDNARIAVECKRVTSADALDDRIREAHTQIRKRIQSGHATCGIIATSISKLVHQVSQERPQGYAGDPEELARDAKLMLEHFGPVVSKIHGSLGPEAIALVLHYKLPFIDSRTGFPIMLSRFAHYPLSFGEHEWLDNLNEVLGTALTQSVHQAKNE